MRKTAGVAKPASTSMSVASMVSAVNRIASGRGAPSAPQPGDFEAERRLRGRFGRDIGDLEVAAPEVERDLAMARCASGCADLLERGIDLIGNPVLSVKLEAEKTCRRNHH